MACGGDGGGSGGNGGDGAGGTGGIGPGGGDPGGGGEGGMGGDGGGGGETGGGGTGGGVVGPDAVIEMLGDPNRVLLKGWLVTPSNSMQGEILVEDDIITCVATSCSNEPGAATASIVQTNGIILPGMIDTHNHILFDVFDEQDWSPIMTHMDHNDWTNPNLEPGYAEMLDAKQYLNGQNQSPINLTCELDKFGELKALVAGTTSVVGASNNGGNLTCYRTVARTIDGTANGLCGAHPPQSCPDSIQVHSILPSNSAAQGVCTNFGDGDTEAYIAHRGEGINATALNEWEDLKSDTTPAGCLVDARTTIVHATAFGDTELQEMADAGMMISWSPRSNVFLYGGGTDLSATTNIPLALTKGIGVALSPDWSMGGGANLLEELKFADMVDNAEWGDVIDAQLLVEMVTINAAEALALEDQIGVLAVGYKADITVVGGDTATPYQSIVDADPDNVRLVMLDGRVLYGDSQLEPLGPTVPGCESVDICGTDKFLCIAIDDTNQKFDQTYADISSVLEQALVDYDTANGTAFAPLPALAECQ
jgi:5-methylthioadenosine/S-adenosylhomocysteine deaminase